MAVGAVLVGLIMRATGKYYLLLLASASLVVLGSGLIATWNDSTPNLRFWLDPMPAAFGVTGVTTALLIVSGIRALSQLRLQSRPKRFRLSS